MNINKGTKKLWNQDIKKSVDLYNKWFMDYAPEALKTARKETENAVKEVFGCTEYLSKITADVLQQHPESVRVLRMCTCPPLAKDRLIGLSGVQKNLVDSLEKKCCVPPGLADDINLLKKELDKIVSIFNKLIDKDIFTWLLMKREPAEHEILRSVSIIADRMCMAVYDPDVRNAQEKRQLDSISRYLEDKEYVLIKNVTDYKKMAPGTFAFHVNIPTRLAKNKGIVDVSVDVVILPRGATAGDLPILIEAKSAGDFANVNKRRKEEAEKMQRLKKTYGKNVRYYLFLNGYFDMNYLSYEADKGIDWIWEHRIDDLQKLGI